MPWFLWKCDFEVLEKLVLYYSFEDNVLRIIFRSAGKVGHVCQHPSKRFRGISGALTVAWLVNVFPSAQAMLRTNRGTIGGFFLAGRDVTWWPVSESKLPGDKFPVCMFKDKPIKHVDCWSCLRCIACLLSGVSFPKPLASELSPVILINENTSPIMRAGVVWHLERAGLALIHIFLIYF